MIYTFYAHAHLSRFYIRFKICVSGVGFGAATDFDNYELHIMKCLCAKCTNHDNR